MSFASKPNGDNRAPSLCRASHLVSTMDSNCREVLDETNPVYLRSRKPSTLFNTSIRFLEKVAKAGEYEISFEQTYKTLSGNRVPETSDEKFTNQKAPANRKADPASTVDDFPRKKTASGQYKLRRTIQERRRKFSTSQLFTVDNSLTPKGRRKLSLQSWRADILSHLSGHQRNVNKIKKLVWNGVPSSIRGEVWLALIGNHLNISRTLYNKCLELCHRHLWQIEKTYLPVKSFSMSATPPPVSPHFDNDCPTCSFIFANVNSAPLRQEICFRCPCSTINCIDLKVDSPTKGHSPHCHDRYLCIKSVKRDISLTFHSLRLFQPGCPFHAQLHNLLAAYVVYQPRIGYVPGMSYLAAVLLLVVPDPFDSFVLFANILDKPCHRAFYASNESEFVVYFRAFNQLLSDRIPRLHAHFTQVGMEPNIYLFDWLFNIFSRAIPLEAALRVWDLYCAEGDVILFRVALALLIYFQRDLVQLNFDQLICFLTNPLPLKLTGDQLVKEVSSIRLKRKVWMRYLCHSRSDFGLLASRSDQFIVPTIPTRRALWSDRAILKQNSNGDLEFSGTMNSKNWNDDISDWTNFRPGLVDHSIRSLYSPSSTISSCVFGDEMEQCIQQYISPVSSTGPSTAIDWDLDEKTPLTVGPTPSPFSASVFTFDEVPSSAPPYLQPSTPRSVRFVRWTSDWILSQHLVTDPLTNSLQTASAHELNRPSVCSPRSRLTPILRRSQSALLHSFSSEIEKKERMRYKQITNDSVFYELIP